MLFNQDKIILDLCGGTGSWSRPYRDAGYDVRVITLPENDVCMYKPPIERKMPFDIYGILAAPPCTHFSNSGAQYWNEKDIDGRTRTDLAIVSACCRIILASDPVFWAIENPVGRLREWMGPAIYSFNPCDFGGYLKPDEYTNKLAPQDAYTKKTLLWGNFKRPLKRPVMPIFVQAANGDNYSPINMATGGKSVTTKTIRSQTPKGFARAFFEANQ